jgi:hypothetical protein
LGSTLPFGLKVTNGDSTDYPEVGQLIAADQFQGGVGPGGFLSATVEHQDASTGRWITDIDPMPPIQETLTSLKIPASALGRGVTLLTTYRLTLTGIGGNGGTTVLHGMVIDERLHKVLADTTVSLCVEL